MIDGNDLSFHAVFGSKSFTWEDGLRNLWKSNYPDLSEDEIEKRLRQVVLVVVDEKRNAVVGVSTAFKTYVSRFKNNLYAFRCFIDPAYRMAGLTAVLTVRTRDHLQTYARQDDCVGMITVVEHVQLGLHMRHAVWRASKMQFMGNTEDGKQIRVYYFPSVS